MTHTEIANPFFAVLALACAALVVTLAAVGLAGRLVPGARVVGDAVLDELGPRARPLAATIATVATFGSLYYSEVAHFTPCVLCWYQRICMYPLVAILWVGVLRRDAATGWYAVPFVVVGPLISTYHVLVERWPTLGGSLSCSAEAPCAVPWFTEFGFVTLAWMALFGFLAIGALLLVASIADRRAGAWPSPPEPASSTARTVDDAGVPVH